MIYYVIMSLLNFLLTVLFYILDIHRKTKTKKTDIIFHLLIGIAFGIGGCIATEYGRTLTVPLSNVRDAFPISAGLLFSGESGIIAGLITGAYRFFAPSLASGSFTKISCTVTAIVAGIASAIMRKFFFKNKCPTVYLAAIFGIFIEAIHLSMIFVIHPYDIQNAFILIRESFFNVIIANSVSIALTVVVYRILDNKFNPKCKCNKNGKKAVVKHVGLTLITCVISAFVIMGLFIYFIQTRLSINGLNSILNDTLADIKQKINIIDEKRVTEDSINLVLESYYGHVHDDGELILINRYDYTVCNDEHFEKINSPFPLDETKRQNLLHRIDYMGKKNYYMYTAFKEFFIIVLVPSDNIMFFRNITIYMVTLMTIILFSILFFSSYVLIKSTVIHNLRSIIEAMVKFKGQNIEEIACIKNQNFMPISQELNYTFELLNTHYMDLTGQMTEEHKNKEKFEYLSQHDKLTNILNRDGFNNAIKCISKDIKNIAFLFIDVDKFKNINDTYGHDKGDKILKKIAKRIKTTTREYDIFTRYGGDEFVLLLIGCTSKEKEKIIPKIHKINDILSHPEDGLPPVTISVGVAFSEVGYNNELLLEADKALYIVKENGRADCYCSDKIIK